MIENDDTRYSEKYIFFFDKDDELRAGKIHETEESDLLVHSLRINSRGLSKLYYYKLKESEIFEFISKECALHFVHEEKVKTKRMTENLSVGSKKAIKMFLLEMNNQIDFSVQTDNLNEYDDTLDRFGLDELDYKILGTLLSKSAFTSLSERTTRINLSEVIDSLFSAPSISDYYSALVRLFYLSEKQYSITKYKDGTIKKGCFKDIFKEKFVFQKNWKFITVISFANLNSGEVCLEISLNITSYINILEILIDENRTDNTRLFSLNNLSLFEYLTKRVTSELVTNSDSLLFELEELKYYELWNSHNDEQIKKAIVSAMTELCNETSIEIEYKFSNNSIEMNLQRIAAFNKRFFNHSKNEIEVGDFIIKLSSMLSIDE